MWTTEKTLTLIDLFHSMPCLWDITCPDYKNRTKKKDAIQKMANEYSVNYYEIEKKIHSLKTQFRREHKKFTGSEKSDCSPKKCAWFGYEPLLFLLQGSSESRGSRSTDDHLSEDVESVASADNKEKHIEEMDPSNATRNETPAFQTEDNANHNFRTPKRVHSRPAKRRVNEDKWIDEAYNFMKTVLEQSAKRDEYCVYGEHVANKLRNCGRNRYNISIAQHKINNILFDLEMGAYERHNFQPSNYYLPPHPNWPNHPSQPSTNVPLPPASQNYPTLLQNISSATPSPSSSTPESPLSNARSLSPLDNEFNDSL